MSPTSSLGDNLRRIRSAIGRLEAEFSRRPERFDSTSPESPDGNATTTAWSPASHKMGAMKYLLAVAGVAVFRKYRLRLLFDDRTVGDVDFSAQEWPRVFELLRDPSYFAQVRVDPEAGTIVWPNGLDMAPEPLYEEARRHPLAAA